jgi:hypothetical protein
MTEREVTKQTHCRAVFDFFGFYRVIQIPFPPRPTYDLLIVVPSVRWMVGAAVVDGEEFKAEGQGLRRVTFQLKRHCRFPVHWAEYEFKRLNK